MDKAQLILYGVATYLAIKSLVSLMSDHRHRYKTKLAAELKAAAAAAPVTLAETSAKVAAPGGQRTPAAATRPGPVNKNAAKNTAKAPVNEAQQVPAAKKAG